MNLSKEEIVRHFASYGIRVDCQVLQNRQYSQTSGSPNEIKIFCPSKYTKENLRDSAHMISGQYLELFDPYNIPFSKERPFVLEPSFSTSLNSFNSSTLYLTVGDLKVYFTQLAMENGLDLKLDLTQRATSSRTFPLFRVFVSSLEEAKELAKMAHQVGHVCFRLVITLTPQNKRELLQNNQNVNEKAASKESPTQRIQQQPQEMAPRVGTGLQMNSAEQTSGLHHSQIDRIHSGYQSEEVRIIRSQNRKIATNEQLDKKINKRKQEIDLQSLWGQNQPQGKPNCTNLGYSDFSGPATYPAPIQSWANNQVQPDQDVEHQHFQNLNVYQDQYMHDEQVERNFDGHPTQNIGQLQYAGDRNQWSEGREVYFPQTQTGNRKGFIEENHPRHHQDKICLRKISDYQSYPADNSLSSHSASGKNNSTSYGTFNGYANKVRNVDQVLPPLQNPENYQEIEPMAFSGFKGQLKESNCLDFQGSEVSNFEESFCQRESSSQIQSQISTPSKTIKIAPGILTVNPHTMSNKVQVVDGARLPNLAKEANTIQTNYISPKTLEHGQDIKEPQRHHPSHYNEAMMLEDPALDDDISLTKPPTEEKKKKPKTSSTKTESKKSKSSSSSTKYNSVLNICYGQREELSEAWLKRIYQLAEKLKEMPHNLFGSSQDEITERLEKRRFCGLPELHPLGKFMFPHLISTLVEPDDSYIEESVQPKYDSTTLIPLDFGLRNFGGNHFAAVYSPFVGTSEEGQEALIGVVSRARLSETEHHLNFEEKSSILDQSRSDVLEWATVFRTVRRKQLRKEEESSREKETKLLRNGNKKSSLDYCERLTEDQLSGFDHATKSTTTSDRSSAQQPGITSVLLFEDNDEIDNNL